MKYVSFIPVVALAIVGATTIAPKPASADTIAEIAVAMNDLSALVEAASAVDLVDTLAGTGSFTVFAPTNSAFNAIPQETREVLERRPDILKTIILYHVLGDEKFATDVLATNNHTTLQGERVWTNIYDGHPFVEKSKITATDIDADNGVVHLIDAVMIPWEARYQIEQELKNQDSHNNQSNDHQETTDNHVSDESDNNDHYVEKNHNKNRYEDRRKDRRDRHNDRWDRWNRWNR